VSEHVTDADNQDQDSPAQLRRRLDDYLFTNDEEPTAPQRRRALQRGALVKSGHKHGDNPGYRQAVWNIAKKDLGDLPSVGPEDLIQEAYAAALSAINRGETPTDSIARFFGSYLRYRKIDVLNRHNRRDRSHAKEAKRLKDRNDPDLEDEIRRLKKSAYVTWASLDEEDESGQSMLDTLAAEQQGPDEAEALDQPRIEEIHNSFRLCLESCTRNLEDLSAVLTWTTLELDPMIRFDDAPQQTTGLHADKEMRWPALWFACQNQSLFRNNTSATRRRRYRFEKISDLRARAIHLLETTEVPA